MLPKKSFRLKFKGFYGDPKVTYDIFDNGQPLELEDLVLRSGSQDYDRCMIRDEFFTSLMKSGSPTLLVQDYRPVALYVNGEYFGLYYLREKIDNHFVARQLGTPSDSIDVLFQQYAEKGSAADYNRLMTFVANNDMTDESNYKHIADNFDLQGLIDYKIGEIYSGNTDVGNIRYARSSRSGVDNKWRFIFYDLDATWVGDKPDASYYLGTNMENPSYNAHNRLINRLLPNKTFRALFLERLSYHLTNTLSEEHTTAMLDSLVNVIRPEMELNCKRWPQLSYNTWEKNIESFRAKFATKPAKMLNDLRRYLSITSAEDEKYFKHLGY